MTIKKVIKRKKNSYNNNKKITIVDSASGDWQLYKNIERKLYTLALPNEDKVYGKTFIELLIGLEEYNFEYNYTLTLTEEDLQNLFNSVNAVEKFIIKVNSQW